MSDCGCSSDQTILIQIVQNVVQQMIANGQIQPALMACDGSPLMRTKVAQCTDLKEAEMAYDTKLRNAITNAIQNIQTASPLKGKGTEQDPIALDENGILNVVDLCLKELINDGTIGNAIGAGEVLKANSNLVGVETEGQVAPSIAIGGNDVFLGRPKGFIQIAPGLGVPVYSITAVGIVNPKEDK